MRFFGEDLNKAEARVTALLQEIEATRAAAMNYSSKAKSASARAESMAVALASAKSGSCSDMKLATAEARVTALEVVQYCPEVRGAKRQGGGSGSARRPFPRLSKLGRIRMMSTVNKLEDTIARLQDVNKEANRRERLKTRLSAVEKLQPTRTHPLGTPDRQERLLKMPVLPRMKPGTARAELRQQKTVLPYCQRERLGHVSAKRGLTRRQQPR